MRIHSVTIHNFLTVRDASLDCAPTNILLGLNGSGKTSILSAIQLALYGWCKHTTRAGAGYAELIGPWDNTAVVQVRADNLQITLTLTAKSREREVIDTDTGEIIELPAPDARALVSGFPSQIVHSAEFSDLLATHLRSAINPASVLARIEPQHAEFTLNLMERHRLPQSPDGFEALGTIAYEKRRDVARDLKLAEGVIKEIGFLPPVKFEGRVMAVHDIAALTAGIRERTHRIGELQMFRGRAEQAGAAVDVIALKRERDELLALSVALEKYRKAEDEYQAAESAYQQTTNVRQVAERAADIVTKCPTCGAKLSAKKQAELRVEAAAAVTAARDAEAAAMAASEAAFAALAPLEVPDAPPLAEIYERMTEIRIALDTQYDGPPVADIIAEIAEAEQWIENAKHAGRLLERHRELEDAKAHATSLRGEWEHLDYITKAFHDGVILKACLAEAAAPLMTAVGQVLPGALELRPEGKTFSLYYDGNPVKRASDGQRALIAFAMADAFAGDGYPVIMDDVNHLDPVRRGVLLAQLRDRATGTVILAGTPLDRDIDKLAEAVAPMAVHWISENTAVTVTAGEIPL